MSNYAQKPKARVNITLDLDTSGSKEKKELPLKLLMLGDYSNSANNTALAKRPRLNITKSNFQQAIGQLKPTLDFTTPNRLLADGSELHTKLTFNHFSDFQPENIAKQIPAIKNLIAMRNLLKDLKATLIDKPEFSKALEKIIQQSSSSQQLLSELKKTAPLQQ